MDEAAIWRRLRDGPVFARSKRRVEPHSPCPYPRTQDTCSCERTNEIPNSPRTFLSISRRPTFRSAAHKGYDQPMSEPIFYPRSIERRLAEALKDSPVVLIHGPRQCGKTTLAQFTCAPNYLTWGDASLTWGEERLGWGSSRQHRDYTYISFDNAVVRDGARSDPLGFVADLPERVILDEIQRVPNIFEAIKIEVDRHRVPGRFVLTSTVSWPRSMPRPRAGPESRTTGGSGYRPPPAVSAPSTPAGSG